MYLSRMPTGDPEIFASIQGEGVSAGVPSVFVRTAYCLLKCGFCDSRYTWDWDRYDREFEILPMEPDEVAERVREVAGEEIRNLVLTGGEPLMQDASLARIASSLKERGFRVEVETSGTIHPSDELAVAVDQWNVSPKLENSGNPRARREVPEALEWFARHANAYWKFVVVAPDDLPEIHELVERYRVPKERVILMPEGTDAETIEERSRWLAGICQQTGFRLGPRLHVMLWGAARGR